MPPMPVTWDAVMFADAARAMGYHPFKSPGGITSTSYMDPYGMQMGPCTLCGICERSECFQYSKSPPQTMILDEMRRMPNFSYRVNAEVLRIEKAPDGQTATDVTYWDEAAQEEVFQPAIILNGAEVVSTEKRPMRLRMQGCRDRLNDVEVAELATFLRTA